MQHSDGADQAAGLTVSRELLSGKHESSSLPGTGRTAEFGHPQPRDRRTPAWLLSLADGNAEPARAADGNVAEAQARIRTRRMLKAVAGAGDRWRVLLSRCGSLERRYSGPRYCP
jgi:hypothetical protein